ncbi:sodium- and chloride-dependent GABA transporter ine isoform X1 [Diorhabda sublineata]|uniref:sodium- and chloride-dependent GABA transporter ine isoform X1 n=1 Tax=Diorhabda sublineata TaxID=1163346 RepID=UPI0024E12340|nr:sodium- and chloride-dependent GABA transporter ine isoform X1 [Diorhabda sublineata]
MPENNLLQKANKMEDCGLVMKEIKPNNTIMKRMLKSEIEVIPVVEETEENDCDIEPVEAVHKEIKEPLERKLPSPAGSLRKASRTHHSDISNHSFNSIPSHQSSPNFKRNNSIRSLKNYYHLMNDLGQKPPSSESGIVSKSSDAASLRSWSSVCMGSTDGKKMIVRRVPTSPVELFNIVNPPTPPEVYNNVNNDTDNDSDDEDIEEFVKPRRQQWSNKLQFVLASVGYSVGLGSIWRFPYLCYKSGGAVFLIPYAIIMVFIGGPMLYMELAVGQFTGRGPIGALGYLCPLLKGTGIGSVVISFLLSTYYSVIIAYGIFYFFTSFRVNQPWADCGHRWNTQFCWDQSKHYRNETKPLYTQSPAEEFYDIKVLQISKGIEDSNFLRWELVACLICAWVLIYFAIWKSIKSSAKVRYFTATFPFVIIIILLIKSLTLEGADLGMRYFFKPKFELLLNAKVWVNAASQTFNSMGCAFGSMICFASYNKYNNSILPDTVAVWVVNSITSLIVGIFAFATIGNIATEQGTSIEDVVDDGPGLIFVVYPQAIAKMPAAQLWAVFFFFMLICLALNSQFAIVEVVVTSIQDGFPGWISRNLMCHEILVLIICVVSLLCGIPNVTRGGIYFFQLIDHYAASISIMYLAFFEVIAITWFYGAWKLSKNVKTMTGRHPGYFIKFCWLIATPLMIFALWVFLIIDYEPPTYNNGVYHYPVWAVVLGWIIAAMSILCIPVTMMIVFLKSPGSTFKEKLKNSIKSDILEKCPKCSEMDCDCTLDEDEGPMLIVKPVVEMKNIKEEKTAEPLFPTIDSSTILQNHVETEHVEPSETLSEYDNVAEHEKKTENDVKNE